MNCDASHVSLPKYSAPHAQRMMVCAHDYKAACTLEHGMLNESSFLKFASLLGICCAYTDGKLSVLDTLLQLGTRT